MSLSLELGTRPHGLEAQCIDSYFVYLGDHQISMVDFCELAKYALTNTDLSANDPRRDFLAWAVSLQIVAGFNPPGQRLEPI